MIEIKFQGRGGQGVVVASEILARACFEEALYPQCYSIFGGERRGAPVAAFVRVSREKIHLKCEIERPNHLVLFDPSLLTGQQVSELVVNGGLILFNMDDGQALPSLEGYTVGRINAREISKRSGLGKIVNTAILGAYVGLTRIVKLDTLLKVIKQNAPAAAEKNLSAAQEAYERISQSPTLRMQES